MTRDRRVAYDRVVCRVVKRRLRRVTGAAGATKGVPLVGRDPKPTRIDREAKDRSETTHGRIVSQSNLGVEVQRSETTSAGAVARALMPFVTRDDGWLRVVPHDNGLTVYFKWKWTRGPHVNHYVMVRYTDSQSAEALTHLASKVHAVDSGEQRPVKDHYFEG